VILGLAGGCQGPVGRKAPPGESSTGDGGTTAAVGTTDAVSSSSDGLDPSRPSPPPFVLPEGCGDGVIVPGQYDCFFPVSIDWVVEALGGYALLHPFDLEGDGRSEVLAINGGRWMAVLRWEDDELRLGPLIEVDIGYFSSIRVQTRWDWNRDGRPDVTLYHSGYPGKVGVHHNLGAEGLGEHVLEHRLPPLVQSEPGLSGNTGFLVPIDVDGLRKPELLFSMIVGAFSSSNPAEDLVLHRHTGTTWVPAGDPIRWGPCGLLDVVAYGDFDEDGDTDLAVLDHGQACDPFPPYYDPDYYRVGVLLATTEGTLELGGWYPTGGMISEPLLWAEDVGGDGHLDLVVGVSELKPCMSGSGTCIFSRAAVMRGNGDGTFDEGTPIDLEPLLSAYLTVSLIDVDGDGAREWITPLRQGRPWVIPFDFSPDGIAPMVALNDVEAGGVTRFGEAVGDINGDGVDDYRVRAGTDFHAPRGDFMGEFLMVSAP
jgi:hypothetical protein